MAVNPRIFSTRRPVEGHGGPRRQEALSSGEVPRTAFQTGPPRMPARSNARNGGINGSNRQEPRANAPGAPTPVNSRWWRARQRSEALVALLLPPDIKGRCPHTASEYRLNSLGARITIRNQSMQAATEPANSKGVGAIARAEARHDTHQEKRRRFETAHPGLARRSRRNSP